MDYQTATLLFAALTAVATLAAAATAIFGPRSAAKYALLLQRAQQEGDRKFQIFLILMSHRKNYGQTLAMQHLNVIDVLWRSSRDVKSAWAEMYESLKQDGFSVTQKEERFRRLLGAIASDLQIGGELSADDFQRSYYSTAAGLRDEAEFLQNQSLVFSAQNTLQKGLPADLPRPTADICSACGR